MTSDHLATAERLSSQIGVTSYSGTEAIRDAAQVHATIAVAHELRRIEAAIRHLGVVLGAREGDGR